MKNVCFPAEQPLQIVREAEKVVVGWPLELDQKIETALSGLSAAGIRTEQRNSANRVLLKKLVISAQRAQDALPGEIVFRALFHCRVRLWCTDVSFRQLRAGRRKSSGQQCNRGLVHCCNPHLYSITSSARTRNDSEIVRPIAFAVLILTTRSNLVACSTGRSAGFVPCKIFCTRTALRRNR